MERQDYENLNQFARKDFEETEEGAELVKKWREEDDATSSSMFDH